jgi:galactoside O-acetyltransferase
VILPGVEIGVGAAVGALTLVKKNVQEFTIVGGNPMRVIGSRGRAMLDYENKVLASPGESRLPHPESPAS